MGFFLTQQHKGLLENIFKISFTSIRYSIIREIHQKAFKFHATSNCRLRTNMFENITIQQSIVITKSTGIFENALNLKYFPRTFSFLRTLFSLVLSKRWQEDVPRIVRFWEHRFRLWISHRRKETFEIPFYTRSKRSKVSVVPLLIYSLLITTNL